MAAGFLLTLAALAAPQAPAVELDHVFIVVRPGAPEAAVLRQAGLRVTPDTTVHQELIRIGDPEQLEVGVVEQDGQRCSGGPIRDWRGGCCPRPRAALELDDGRAGRMLDARPVLPLVIRY